MLEGDPTVGLPDQPTTLGQVPGFIQPRANLPFLDFGAWLNSESSMLK